MKVSELREGDFFKLKNQRKYKKVRRIESLLKEDLETFSGEILIIYDNCKQLVTRVEVDCEILFLEKINGYTEEYTNSHKRIAVKIGSFKTEISETLKNGNASMYHFCIKSPNNKWIDIDLRGLKGFPINAYNYFECQNGLQLFYEWIIINRFDSFPSLMTFTQETF